MPLRVLLVSPKFHGYWRAIKSAIERDGAEVHTHLYDDYGSRAGKLRHKLVLELPQRVSGQGRQSVSEVFTQRALAAVRVINPDLVLTVKGDVLGPAYWDELNRRRCRTAIWLYDELRRTSFDLDLVPNVDVIASYSGMDVGKLQKAGRDALYLPLAFDTSTSFTPRVRDEIAFVGARYPSRLQLLEELQAAGVDVRAYGRDWSRHPVDRLRTWELTRSAVPSDRDLSRSDAYGVFAGAAGCINTHANQDGFTMRTFEIPGAGGMQLIDREDVGEFYDPGSEVVVFTSPDELAEVSRRAQRDTGWRRGIADKAQRRTLAHHTFDHRLARLLAFWN